jgi:hypothetical protein
MAPAPDETIRYDAGPLVAIPLSDSTARYWAVQFTPGGPCTLKLGLVGTIASGSSPACSLFVWEDSSGVPREPPVFQSVFTSTGLPDLDSVSVGPAITCSLEFWIGYWLPNPGPDTTEQDLAAADSMPPSVMSFVSTDRVNWDSLAVAFPGFYNLGVRAVVSYIIPSRHDVEPKQILRLPDTVFCDSGYALAAEVFNAGTAVETFDVILEIDTSGSLVMIDTQQIVGLDTTEYDTTNFETFWVLDVDSIDYGVLVYTTLAGDDSTHNDTLADSARGVCLGIHDVGVAGRLSPPDTVVCGEDYPVWAEVANYGSHPEDFDVVCAIGDTAGTVVYQDTAAVLNLEPDSSVVAIFDSSWAVPASDSATYEVVFSTNLAVDTDPSNDTLRDSVYSHCMPAVDRDVSVLSILAPPDTVLCDSSVAVMAYVANHGTRVEFFNVECIIDSGEVVYADTGAAPGLQPGDSMLVSFLRWSVPTADTTTYAIRVRTLLVADTLNANDTLSKTCLGICAVFHDVGIEEIVEPPDTVFVGFSYTPRVNVHNWGTSTEDFQVVCTIGAYADTQLVAGLEPGWSLPVFFDIWTVDSAGACSMSVAAVLVEDENPVNDTAFKILDAVTGLEDEYLLPRIPLESGLLQNVPNPLSTHTDIYYQIAVPGEVSVSVYDLSGRLVKILFEGELAPGYYSARWEVDDEAGSPVPSGIYVAKLGIGRLITSKKLVVVR